MERVCQSLRGKIMSPAEAAKLVYSHAAIGSSGFAQVGYPKAVPTEIARQGKAQDLTLYTGASVGPQLDGELCGSGAMSHRYPYQANKVIREAANNGTLHYADMHLSQMPSLLEHNQRPLDFAIVECAAVREDGVVLPPMVGAADKYLRLAKHIILEVNENLPLALCGMHDIYQVGKAPIPIASPADRIGTATAPCDFSRVAAVVLTKEDSNYPVFKAPDETSRTIASYIVDFLKKEVEAQRQPKSLSPLQSGAGSVANAVLDGLATSGFTGLQMYTEVVQDAALRLIRDGIMSQASTTAVSVSREMWPHFIENVDFYREHIVIRPQEISNHSEVVRRLGVIAMNTPLECDIYGHVNSSHIMGTRIMNGIGGSGDFTRNAGLSIFTTESVAKGGAISCIVPMCAHVDHTEHDVQVIVTEQGLADLRWKSPRERAELIIERCTHPDYRPLLREYYQAACRYGGHVPHDLRQALSWHQRYLDTGTMKE